MKHTLQLLILSISIITIHAQSVGIGTTNPHASAQLQVSSTTKGFLPPRMTSSQRQAIASPMNGLMVYDTDAERLYSYMDGNWQQIVDGGMWLRVGGNHRQILNFTDSVAIGTISPAAKFTVSGEVQFNSPEFRLDGSMKITNGAMFINGGNLSVATGNIQLINGDLTVYNGTIGVNNSNMFINSAGGTLELQSGGVQKGFVQLSGDNLRVGTFSSNTEGKFIVRVGGADRVYVDEVGRVGIGVSSPTEKLDVAGSINFNGRITNEGTGGQPLTPFCYGILSNINGALARSTGNVSVTHIATGQYSINCPLITSTTIAMLQNLATGTVIGGFYDSPGKFLVYIRRSDTNEAIDQGFSFLMY